MDNPYSHICIIVPEWVRWAPTVRLMAKIGEVR